MSATPQAHLLGHTTIADHCFSPDRKVLAVARETDADLFSTGGSRYQLIEKLEQHDKTVTSVDISAHGRIVTCSQDRNALVWEPQQDGTFKPTLVLLRINRAATHVRWSPDGSKFAVGSGARVIAICYFEQDNDWWVSKHIKKPLRSTVVSVEWHPNNVLLAAGSTDGNARVFSAYIKSVDERPPPSVWGDRLPFQTLCGEYANPSNAWVHSVGFSPSGDALGFVSHDSTVTVVYPGGSGDPHAPVAAFTIETKFLPFKSLIWVSESSLVAAGHDCFPVVYSGNDQNGWKQDRLLDDPTKSSSRFANDRESSALDMFRQMDLKGTGLHQKSDESLPTVHQNTINTLRAYETRGPNVTKISSSGVDGRLVIFTL